jgi:hypothetical protein
VLLAELDFRGFGNELNLFLAGDRVDPASAQPNCQKR